MVKPKNIFPAHVPPDGQKYLVELAEELGYKKNKNVFVSENGVFRKI